MELPTPRWRKDRAPIGFAERDHADGRSVTWKSSFSQLCRLFFVEYGMSLGLRIFIDGTKPVLRGSWEPHLGTCTAPCSMVLCAFAPKGDMAASSREVLQESPGRVPTKG